MLTCLFFGMLMYFNDENPPNNIVDAIFMAVRAAAARPRALLTFAPRFPPCPARA